PRSGMTRSGTAFLLPPLAPLIDEIESGLRPTPHGMCVPNPRRAGPSGNELGRAVNRSLRPTPTVKGNYNRSGLSSKSGDGLATAVRWATPTARDYRSEKRAPGKREKRMEDSRGTSLPFQVNGSLSPTWVEWLMGFPLGWTALEPSATP